MKHLFVVRHGDDEPNYEINNEGIQQMEELGKEIKDIINSETISIVSSTATRALESAKILAEQIELSDKIEKAPYLWTGPDSPYSRFDHNRDKLKQAFYNRGKQADSLVIVTHYAGSHILSLSALKELFGEDEYIRTPEKGEAVHINLESRTYRMI